MTSPWVLSKRECNCFFVFFPLRVYQEMNLWNDVMISNVNQHHQTVVSHFHFTIRQLCSQQLHLHNVEILGSKFKV